MSAALIAGERDERLERDRAFVTLHRRFVFARSTTQRDELEVGWRDPEGKPASVTAHEPLAWQAAAIALRTEDARGGR